MNSKNIAEIVGVSPATVMRVFSHPEKVKESTRKRVLSVCEEYHYVPSAIASSLRTLDTKTVGLIISSIKNPFFLLIGSSLQDSFENTKGNLVIRFSNENPASENNVLDSLIASRISYLVFTPVAHSEEILNKMKSNNIVGLQLFRRTYDDVSSVVIDDGLGTYLAVDELIKNGHKKILLLDGFSLINTHRKEGYIKAFKDHNLEIDEEYTKVLSLNSDEKETIKELIAKLKPTAIIPVSEQLLKYTLLALKEMDLAIKDDVSIVCYDDSNLAKILNLSAVTHRYQEIIDSVLEILFKENEIIHRVLNPYFKGRNSIKNINNKGEKENVL